MTSYAQNTVKFYCELYGISESLLKSVSSDAEAQGILHNDAAKILTRLLWLSRLSRPDLSFLVGRLAANVSHWSRWGDRQKLRMISYLACAATYQCCGKIAYGHTPVLLAYSNSDFASYPWSAKSTSGIMIGVRTGEAFYPIHWQSRKQREAEAITFSKLFFGESLHMQAILEHLFEIPIPLKLEQDNEAVIRIIRSGFSVKPRYCKRVHRVNIAAIADFLEQDESLEHRYCQTNQQYANALTKIVPPIQWSEALCQLCVRKT